MTLGDWKAAWYGLRGRGSRAAFVVTLLAIAMAANAVMFTFADSLVFHPNPFPGHDRVFRVAGRTHAPGEQLDLRSSATVLDQWRAQGDLVSAAGGIEELRTLDVTLGFFDVLGVRPRWGRAFAVGDERDPGAFAVLISEDLARRRFGQPTRAPGQTLDATAGKLVVVGVMDGSFAFPGTRHHIWRSRLTPMPGFSRRQL